MTEHGPRSAKKRERRCLCGAGFRTAAELRRHIREQTALPEPTWYAAAPVRRGTGGKRR